MEHNEDWWRSQIETVTQEVLACARKYEDFWNYKTEMQELAFAHPLWSVEKLYLEAAFSPVTVEELMQHWDKEPEHGS